MKLSELIQALLSTRELMIIIREMATQVDEAHSALDALGLPVTRESLVKRLGYLRVVGHYRCDCPACSAEVEKAQQNAEIKH